MNQVIRSSLSFISKTFQVKPFLQLNKISGEKLCQLKYKSCDLPIKVTKQENYAQVKVLNFLRRSLNSCRRTIPENAFKLSNKLNRGRSYLWKDYIARRARYNGYLFSFGGFLYMQEDLYLEEESKNKNFQKCYNLCSLIKEVFPIPHSSTDDDHVMMKSCFKKSALDETENSIIYQLEKKVNLTFYQKVDFQEDSFNPNDSFEIISNHSDDDFSFITYQRSVDAGSETSFEVISSCDHSHPNSFDKANIFDDNYDVSSNESFEIISNEEDANCGSFNFEISNNFENELTNKEIRNQSNYILEVVSKPDVALALPLKNNHLLQTSNNTQLSKWVKGTLNYHPNIISVEEAYIEENLKYFQDISTCTSKMEFKFYFNLPNPFTLHLISKGCEFTLNSFLSSYKMNRKAEYVGVLQVLEAVAYLQSQNVVHRNITTKTVHVNLSQGKYPHFLIGNFSHSLCGEKNLKVPFESIELDTRLPPNKWQAFEITSSTPSRGNYINYSNADVFSVGVIAQQIFDSNNYEEEISTSDSTSRSQDDFFRGSFVSSLLESDYKKRLNANEAADILHVKLMSPIKNINLTSELELYEDFMRWMIDHYVKSVLKRRHDQVLSEVCRCFFSRIDFCRLLFAFKWLFTNTRI